MTPKERILQYIEKKGITQYAFSKRTGLSNGFLKAGSSLRVDNLLIISNSFDDLNIEIGHVQNGHTNTIDHSPIHVSTDASEVTRLKSEIKHLEELLAAKDEIINLLKHK